eukprot:4909137-Prymnesium_polylepis.1
MTGAAAGSVKTARTISKPDKIEAETVAATLKSRFFRIMSAALRPASPELAPVRLLMLLAGVLDAAASSRASVSPD